MSRAGMPGTGSRPPWKGALGSDLRAAWHAPIILTAPHGGDCRKRQNGAEQRDRGQYWPTHWFPTHAEEAPAAGIRESQQR